ncbi:MAG: immunoglobulin domain-containing protein [Phycisphaerales bacterium]|nr:immunoglobulin domain-containing protein [Phycisphaerales bacterium]
MRRRAFVALLTVLALAVPASAQVDVLIRDAFTLGPRPKGNGRERDAGVHTNLHDFWTQIPADGTVRWTASDGDGDGWFFAASSVDAFEWPEDQTYSSNGTIAGEGHADCFVPFVPSGAFAATVHVVDFSFASDGIAIGVTRAATPLQDNLGVAGEFWLLYDGEGAWQLTAKAPYGVLASGTGASGNAFSGFTPIGIAYDPTTNRVSVNANARWIAEVTLPFTPSFGFIALEARNEIVSFQVANNFVVRSGPRSLFTQTPSDQQVSIGSSAVFDCQVSPPEAIFRWCRDGLPLDDGATTSGSIISGSGTPLLRLDGVSALDQGVYECLVISQAGSEFSVGGALAVSSGCSADFNGDGFVNGDDYDLFAEAFDAGDAAADFNDDSFVNGNDYDEFAGAFDAGC